MKAKVWQIRVWEVQPRRDDFLNHQIPENFLREQLVLMFEVWSSGENIESFSGFSGSTFENLSNASQKIIEARNVVFVFFATGNDVEYHPSDLCLSPVHLFTFG